MKEQIRKMILDMGADVCGIGAIDRFVNAPLGFSPIDIYPDCRSVISFGIALPKGTLEVNPRLIYGYFNGPILCTKVDEIAFDGAKKLEEMFSCAAVPLPCDGPNEYWESENLKVKGLISMKHTAVACGLGQLGKSTLLLNPQYGNRLTVGAILTNLALDSDELCENICLPDCKRCMEACPVDAISAEGVCQKKCRPNTYGKTARGFDTVDCNKCRSVCPMKYGR